MTNLLVGLLLMAEALVALMVIYLLLLSLLAWLWPVSPTPVGPAGTCFAVLIPAHNEELLLPDLLDSLTACDYDPLCFDIHVVADNCTDRTADLVRDHMAQSVGGPNLTVHERFNDELIGKGYALQWLIERVIDPDLYDAYIVIDADSVVTPAFLREMDGAIQGGADAVQGYYAIRDVEVAWAQRLRKASLALLHYVRPLGRKALGLSPGLKGNGMAFTGHVLAAFPWSASLTEDVEYHLRLILANKRVVFAPGAVVRAEMPGSLRKSHTQHVRWERGRLEMVRQYVPELLRVGLGQRRWQPIDAAIEQVLPPFSVFIAVILLLTALGALLGSAAAVWLGMASLVGVLAYVLGGQAIAGSPLSVYVALLGAPFYIVWKIWLYVRVLVGLDQQGWVRTRREGE